MCNKAWEPLLQRKQNTEPFDMHLCEKGQETYICTQSPHPLSSITLKKLQPTLASLKPPSHTAEFHTLLVGSLMYMHALP